MAVIGGTGDEGYGLALRWVRHGYEVIIGSRTIEKARTAAESITRGAAGKGSAVGLLNTEAVSKADIVVLAVPFSGLAETLKVVKPSFKQSQIVVNVTVPLERAVGGKSTHTLGIWDGSGAEMCARLLPKHVRLVSAFNNVSAEPLNQTSTPVQCDVLVCGDDEEAKRVVAGLVAAIPGLRYVDAGALENSRTVEQLTALLVYLNIKYDVKNAGIRITGIQD